MSDLVDHWWWRPGWSVGRRFYAWHLTFDGQAQVHRLAAGYRAALASVPGLTLVPDPWLHLTMQGLGFAGEVDETDVDAITAAAAERLADVAPFELYLTRPVITPEAIRWDPDSAGPAAVRDAIRAAIAQVWSDVPEPAEGFTAHVTIAYSSADGPDTAVRHALDGVNAAPATARVTTADLIVLNRDHRMYQWVTRARVPLAG